MHRIAVLDVDGTLHHGTGAMSLLDALVVLGEVSPVKRSAVRAVMTAYHAGRISHAEMRRRREQAYLAAVAGVSAEAAVTAAEKAWEHDRQWLFPFVRPLLELLERCAVTPAIVSSCPVELVSVIAADLGVTTFHGSQVIGTPQIIPGLSGKHAVVGRLLREAGSGGTGCLALGHSPGDVGALAQVEHPIVFEPEPELRDVAAGCGWVVADRRNLLQLVAERM